MILIDKPVGWSSRRVVDHVVQCLGMKKVGHAGTLDPFARGVLCVLWGRGTRMIPYLQEYSKTHVFGVEFGRTTDTQDRTGTTVATADAGNLRAEHIEEALHRFRGEIEQVPPMFSAVRVNGKRLYEDARRGLMVERAPRKRRVFTLALEDYAPPQGRFRATVSSGTYIRTLAHDLGVRLGVGATVTQLERTAVGPHTLDRAVAPEALADAGDVAARGLGLGEVLPDWEALRLEAPHAVRRVVTGSWDDPDGLLRRGCGYRVFNAGGDFLALVRGGEKPRFLGVFASGEDAP